MEKCLLYLFTKFTCTANGFDGVREPISTSTDSEPMSIFHPVARARDMSKVKTYFVWVGVSIAYSIWKVMENIMNKVDVNKSKCIFILLVVREPNTKF